MHTRISSDIKKIISDIRSLNPGYKFALGVVTTSGNFNQTYFSYPRLIEKWGYYFHLVCPSTEEANQAILEIGHEFSAFFLDVEHKNELFSFKDIKNKNTSINFNYLYPNELTAQACIDFIEHYNHEYVFILGHGQLAYKLLDILTARSIKVKWCKSRNSKSKKYKQMKLSFLEHETSLLSRKATLFINLSMDISSFIDSNNFSQDIKIIDVSGKGSIPTKFLNNRMIYSLDISPRLNNEIAIKLDRDIQMSKHGSSKDNNGNTFVSGVFSAKEGDFIVDNHENPSFLIGISDGKGGFKKRTNKFLGEGDHIND